jgi:tetratricopeptide (TPR) repeat protein
MDSARKATITPLALPRLQKLAPRPVRLEDTGLSETFVADLLSKHLLQGGVLTMAELTSRLALAGPIVEAVINFMRKDYTRSIEDIRQVLAREPRHFGALAGLGMIMQELGDDKRALEVYRKAIEINPQMQRIPDLIKTLTEKVEGRDI